MKYYLTYLKNTLICYLHLFILCLILIYIEVFIKYTYIFMKLPSELFFCMQQFVIGFK